MTTVSIIIPIYKPKLTINEQASLEQCLKILGHYPIIFFAPEGLDKREYNKLVNKYLSVNVKFEFFNKGYFTSIKGYNKLLVSPKFYKRFKENEYILIYQLDAWVFRDELKYWCDKGYDYIGAPWISKKGNSLLSGVGNGGFSLRKTSTMLEVLNTKLHKRLKCSLLKDNIIYRGFTNLIIPDYKTFPFRYFNFGKIKKLRKASLWLYYPLLKDSIFLTKLFIIYEDVFWSKYAPKLYKNMLIPCHSEGLKFAFELYPSICYETNSKKLPFGCHAWDKRESDFWQKYIII
ncbi:hypothetical protein E9993_15630 [Labilibacter sediminis]|nr:hypothetical protein E9993_15630 [Labilibacter sediminis]